MPLISLTKQSQCHTCGKPIGGRPGKRFCGSKCRNDFNNRQRSTDYFAPFIRRVTNTLIKNRRLLKDLLSDKTSIKVSRYSLIEQRFDFKYYTNINPSANGKSYYYCFDYGYLPLDNDWYLIVKLKK